jgi:hypothetical protein
MKRKNLIYAILITVMAFFTSCEKEILKMEQDQKCSNILTFKNIEEFNTELNNVLKLNTEEKTKWEQQKGFKSFGVAAEKFYETINPDEFKDVEEVKEFVSQNAKYIQLINEDGEYSVEIRFYDEPLRFFINEENIFQIGERAYKVFEKGMISTSVRNMNKLKVIEEINFEQFKNDPDLIFNICNEQDYKSVSSDCSDPTYGNEGGGYDESCVIQPYNKKYRTNTEIRPKHWDDYVYGSIAASWYRVECQVKTLGFWWLHSTTISSEVTAQLVYTDRVHGLTTVNTSDSYTGSSISYIERYSGFISDILTGWDPEPYFNSYNVWGSMADPGAESSVIYN